MPESAVEWSASASSADEPLTRLRRQLRRGHHQVRDERNDDGAPLPRAISGTRPRSGHAAAPTQPTGRTRPIEPSAGRAVDGDLVKGGLEYCELLIVEAGQEGLVDPTRVNRRGLHQAIAAGVGQREREITIELHGSEVIPRVRELLDDRERGWPVEALTGTEQS